MLRWLLRKASHKKLPSNFRDLLDPDAFVIVKKLSEAGFETYLVGGCVRDIMLGKVPKDFDIATAATPQQVKSLIHRAFIIGKRFRIVLAKRRPLKASPGAKIKQAESLKLFPVITEHQPDREIQITTFRREPVLVNGVLNENVFGSAKDDAFRRDFTINALFLDPVKGDIVDFVGGLADMGRKKIEVIGDPQERFKEDPIRILRALRFSARTGFDFSPKTEKALVQSIPHLASAKKERVREEILKTLREGHADAVFKRLYELHILKILIPSLNEFLKFSKSRENFFEILKRLSNDPWGSANQAPLIYLLVFAFQDQLANSSRGHKGGVSMETPLFQELKISRAEWEDMIRIRQNIHRLTKEPKGPNANRIFSQFRHYSALAPTFYTLFILSKSLGSHYLVAWNHLKSDWEKFLQNQQAGPTSSGRGNRNSESGGPAFNTDTESSRRPRRRRRRGGGHRSHSASSSTSSRSTTGPSAEMSPSPTRVPSSGSSSSSDS